MEKCKRKSGLKFREKIYFNGKEIKSPYFSRKSDASAWKRRMELEKDKAKAFGLSSLESETKTCFKDFALSWLTNSIRTKNSQKTFDAYKLILENHLIPTFGNELLNSLNIKHGQAFILELQKNGYKPKGISNIVSVLKSILNEAERQEIVIKSPFKFLVTPKIPSKVPKYWTENEINQFLVSNKEDELYPLYVIALNTGCRKGELAGLKWHQVLFDRNLIEISATRDRYGRREITKNGKNRFVPMNTVTRMTLLTLSKERKSEYVFTHQNGDILRVNHIYRYFKQAQSRSGVETTLTFHMLRDTFASQFMMNGGNIYELQKVLGHHSIDMTQIYAHLSPEHLSGTTKVVSFGEFEDVSKEFRPYIGPEKNRHKKSLMITEA